MSMFKCAKSDI